MITDIAAILSDLRLIIERTTKVRQISDNALMFTNPQFRAQNNAFCKIKEYVGEINRASRNILALVNPEETMTEKQRLGCIRDRTLDILKLIAQVKHQDTMQRNVTDKLERLRRLNNEIATLSASDGDAP